MTEYGIFNDEGCIERQFYSIKEVIDAIDDRYTFEDDLEVHVLCEYHEEQRADVCEECWAEEEDQ